MKYALGTIAGTALLGLAKTKGSKVKLSQGSVLQYGAFYELCTIIYDDPNISPGWGRTGVIHHTFQKEIPIQNCQGNPYLNDAIQGRDGIERSEIELNALREVAKAHDHCIKNKKGQCITLGEMDTDKVKKLTNQILQLHKFLNDNNLYIKEINNHRLNSKIIWSSRQLKSDPILENFELLYEFILKEIKQYGEYETKDIFLDIGFINPDEKTTVAFPQPLPRYMRVHQQKAIKARMYNHLFNLVNPFDFKIRHAPMDFRLQNRQTIGAYEQEAIVIDIDGEWYPYEPKKQTVKLRKR